MAIEFECPSCHRTLRVKDELAGQRGKCPLCNQSIQVPAAGTSPPAHPVPDPDGRRPVRRTRRPASRKRKKRRSQANVPLIVGAIGGAVALVAVVIVVAVVLTGGDDEPDQPEPDATLATEAPQRPSPSPPQRLRTPGLSSYVPAETTMAFGLRFGESESETPEKLAALRPFLRAPIALAGLEVEQVAEAVFACDPTRQHVLAGIRTRSAFAERDLRERLGCADRGEQAGKATVYPTTKFTGWGPLAATFPDGNRTVLIGRPETLQAALVARSGSGNPLVRTFAAGADGPGFWVTGEMNDAHMRVAHRLLPTTWVFPEGSRDAARAIESFSASVDFAEKMNVKINVACRDDEKALEVAGLIDAAIKILEDPPKPAAARAPSEGAAAQAEGGVARASHFYSGVIATSSGRSTAQVSVDGPRAQIDWAASPTGGAARFAWSSLTTMALAPLSPSAEGEQLFPGPLRRLSAGLIDLHAAKGAIPLGAAPREDVHLLQRVSWMAQILPYLGLADLYERIDFKSDWDKGENLAVANTLVEAFLDPRAEEFRWRGYPFYGMALTHYVGMAGLGADAPNLAPGDPEFDARAGIFGYERATKLEDVTDGAANTIMLISAGEIYGPWIVPGGSTIRGAHKPYFGGMTGFGAPGSKPGAVAAFADGSLRFLSADIDPKVFEAMCTMRGGEKVALPRSP